MKQEVMRRWLHCKEPVTRHIEMRLNMVASIESIYGYKTELFMVFNCETSLEVYLRATCLVSLVTFVFVARSSVYFIFDSHF